MKKLLLKRRKAAQKTIPTRITNETVAEHRERILAGGRRFKYPMQYARHRLVFTTIVITLVAFLLILLIGWWQLYPAQTTSTFFYRVTRVVPLPVASVDGESVKYSDYLMYYNSSAHYLKQSEQINLSTKDSRQNDHIRRKSMDIAIANSYALKLARELKINVSQERIDQVTDDDRNTSTGRISQETYDASALSILGWTPSEYRHDTKNRLIRQDVAYAIDAGAKQQQEKATQLIQADKAIDFKVLAETLGGEGPGKVTAAVSGLVPQTNQDGGLTTAAMALQQPGDISSPIRTSSGDGYYFVKLVEKTATQVSYAYVRIPLTEFNQRLAVLKKEDKIKEFINIPQDDTESAQQ